jgi:hypothetical protein
MIAAMEWEPLRAAAAQAAAEAKCREFYREADFPPALAVTVAGHPNKRRARLIAQLHEQAIAAASPGGHADLIVVETGDPLSMNAVRSTRLFSELLSSLLRANRTRCRLFPQGAAAYHD